MCAPLEVVSGIRMSLKRTSVIVLIITHTPKQYSAKIAQSQPLYQFTHCALYVCIETSASRRSSASVTS
jgi:hypothetical protein